jgi:hypothetical protein
MAFIYCGRRLRADIPEDAIAVPCFGYASYKGLIAAVEYAYRYALARPLTIKEKDGIALSVRALPPEKVTTFRKDRYFTFIVKG